MLYNCQLQFYFLPPHVHYIYCSFPLLPTPLLCIILPTFLARISYAAEGHVPKSLRCQAWTVRAWAVGQAYATLLLFFPSILPLCPLTATARLCQLVTAVAKAFISCPPNRLQFINFERNYFITACMAPDTARRSKEGGRGEQSVKGERKEKSEELRATCSLLVACCI